MIPRHRSSPQLRGSVGLLSPRADEHDTRASSAEKHERIELRLQGRFPCEYTTSTLTSLFSQRDSCGRSCRKEGDAMKSLCQKSALPTIRSASQLSSERIPIWSTSHSQDETSSSFSVNLPSTWTVGKVSLIFLVLAALGDLSLQHLKQLNHFEAYDALSTDVIRPAFSYKSSNGARTSKASLGSAAIGSVTNVLSPILPFTGGVDLRREDYWTSSPWETIQSLSTQIADAFSLPRSSGVSDRDSLKVQANSPQTSKVDRPMVLSAPEPFVKAQVIGSLTLSDVSEIFRYVVESSKEGFDEVKFMRKLPPELKEVVLSFRDAVALSRGWDAEDSLIFESDERGGKLDALKFSGAMRIFAEWRLRRQTPDGYKGFAVGMTLGHKDIVQNVVKIEHAVHAWLDHHSGDTNILRSPTIDQLLQHEREMNIHPNLPRLQDKTAAMGLLWVRRQLHYQTSLFANALMVPQKYSVTKDAVVAAYNEVYDQYHGWAVQKIFNYSFQSAPDVTEIYRHMNPQKLQAVKEAVREIRTPRTPSSDNFSTVAVKSGSENPLVAFFQDVSNTWITIAEKNAEENAFVAFFQNVGDTWKAMVDGNELPSSLGYGDDDNDHFEQYLSAEMTKDASQHIALYMQVVEPLLDGLAEVFAKYNMDDPTKV